MAQRTYWVDYAKGIGIILVVYGHLLSSGYNGQLNIPKYFFLLSDSIVYSFHMPLFFVLAGVLVETSYKKRDTKEFLLSKSALLAYPYLVWSFLQVSVEIYFSQHSHRGVTFSDLFAIPYQPWSQFWYLYALLLMYVVYAVFQQFGRYSSLMMITVAIVLFFFPVNTEIMALHGFSIGFLFFVFGVLAKSYRVNLEKISISKYWIFILFPVLIGGGWYVFTYEIGFIRLTSGSHPFFYLGLAGVGISLCISLAQYLSTKKYSYFIMILGRYSLPIYLAHMLAGVATRIIFLKFFSIHNPIIHIMVGVTIGLFAPILLYVFSKRIRFPYLFEFSRQSS